MRPVYLLAALPFLGLLGGIPFVNRVTRWRAALPGVVAEAAVRRGRPRLRNRPRRQRRQRRLQAQRSDPTGPVCPGRGRFGCEPSPHPYRSS